MNKRQQSRRDARGDHTTSVERNTGRRLWLLPRALLFRLLLSFFRSLLRARLIGGDPPLRERDHREWKSHEKPALRHKQSRDCIPPTPRRLRNHGERRRQVRQHAKESAFV